MNTTVSLILLVSIIANYVEGIKDSIVSLPNGIIRGRNNGHYLSFESIPYAEPPTNENRFEDPKPYTESWSNIRDATNPPVKCMQWDQYLFKDDLLIGEEDCLTINVYTPSIDKLRSYPVLVLIHGGAFMFGTAAANGHDYIMETGNSVVVTFNYRLGPLGFLSTEDEIIPGNFGLKDQLLALEWTKANIDRFNGNSANITVLGFSAGGAAVHLHLLNKRLEQLVTGALSFSGTAFCPWVITRNPSKRARALAEHLNCPSDNSAAMKSCLKQQPAQDIVRAVRHFLKFGYNPFTTFGPVIEAETVTNAFLNREPEFIVKNGLSAELPWLASYSREDGGYNAAELMRKDDNGTELIEVMNERWHELAPMNLFYSETINEHQHDRFSNALVDKYLGNESFSSEVYAQVQKLYTEVLFASGVEKAIKMHTKHTRSPVYSYVYNAPSLYGIGQILANRTDIEFGTVHGDDFYLLFKNRDGRQIGLSDQERIMSKKFVKMVEDFALTRKLKFGQCEFLENNSSYEGIVITAISNGGCRIKKVKSLTS